MRISQWCLMLFLTTNENFLHQTHGFSAGMYTYQTPRPRYPQSRDNNGKKRYVDERIRHCETLSELLDLQRECHTEIEPYDISFYWNQVSRFMRNTMDREEISTTPDVLKPLVRQTLVLSAELTHPKALAATAHSIAKITTRTRTPICDSTRVWNVLESNILSATETHTFSSQASANILWSFAKINRRSVPLFDAMADQVMANLDRFNPQEITNSVWAYAKVGHSHPELFHVLSKTIVDKIDKFKSQDVANTIWAYAKIKHSSPELFDVAAKEIVDNIDTFRPQEISNIVWAYATVHKRSSSSASSSSTHDIFEAASQVIIDKLDMFNSQAFSNILWAYTTVNHRSPKLFDAISRLIIQNASNLNAQQISNTLWSYAKMRHSSPNMFNVITFTAIDKLDKFNSQAISNILWSYASTGHPAPELFDAVATRMTTNSNNKLEKFQPRDVANTVWAFAKTENTAPKLFDALAQTSLTKIDKFWPQDIAQTLWAYGKLRHTSSPALFDAASQSILLQKKKNLHTYNSQAISNILWAYATLGYSAPDLFEAASDVVISKVDDFNSQAVANTMWAYATVGHHSDCTTTLFDAISERVIANIDSYDPQAVSNTLWACARTGYTSSELFDTVADTIIPDIENYSSQSISNTVWAYATAKQRAPELFNAVSRVFSKKIHTFNPQEISNTLWSFATMGYSSDKVFDETIQSKIIDTLPQFNPQALSKTLGAYARVGYPAPALFTAASEEVITKFPEFNTQQLSDTVWSYASVGHDIDPKFLDVALTEGVGMLEFLKTTHISKLLWSMAVFDCGEPDAALPFFLEIAKRYNKDGIKNRIAGSLHQASLWYSAEHERGSVLPDQLRDEMRTAFEESASSNLTDLQSNVVQMIKELDPENVAVIEENTRCHQTGYSLNAIVVVGKKKDETAVEEVAVDIDGPSHFVLRLPNGSTKLKRRQLNVLGDKPLVSIPYWEVNDEDIQEFQEEKQKKEYLTRVFKKFSIL